MATGQSLGMQLQPPSVTSSPIVQKNSDCTPSTSFSFSAPSLLVHITKSSTWTKQSGSSLGKSATSNSPVSDTSGTLKPVTSRATDSVLPIPRSRKRKRTHADPLNLVVSGTPAPVTGVLPSVGTGISVPSAVVNTPNRNVRRKIESDPSYLRPRFSRDFLWSSYASDPVSPAAQYSLYADPLPRPPQSELLNATANNTIRDHPELFKITCNIKVDVFASLLADHPNQPFVQSVLTGLREGFWPWAEPPENYPITNEFPQHAPKNDEERLFLTSQCDVEIRAGHFSKPFGSELLPGMNSVPVHSVPKPNSTKLCLVVDHSAGPYSINSMIDRQAIAGVRLDGIKTLGDSIRAFHLSGNTYPLIIWKSDVAAAYRQMPMHPLWQIKQVVRIDGQFCIDRCNNFGGRGSQKIWASFISLVLWLAVHKYDLPSLKCYVDDHFSVAIGGDLELYPDYDAFLPSDQVKLLELWDKIGLPHEAPKQISGSIVPVIGFDVDPNAMTVSMNPTKKDELIAACETFTTPGARKTLREFQRLQGWINWALNVFPKLRPALCESYAKIAGKSRPNAPIRVNNMMRKELSWFIKHVKKSDGIHMLQSVEWFPQDNQASTLIAFVDASSVGMGIWFPGIYAGYQSPLPSNGPKDLIFFYEALAICSAIHLGVKDGAKRIAVFSDNTNSVDMFSSLRAQPEYNSILMSTIDIVTEHGVEFKVYYVPGAENIIADPLSRFRNDVALFLAPKLAIMPFSPPQDALGAVKK